MINYQWKSLKSNTICSLNYVIWLLMLQSDTPTTPTSTGRGRGNNTRERDSDGRDNGKKKAENWLGDMAMIIKLSLVHNWKMSWKILMHQSDSRLYAITYNNLKCYSCLLLYVKGIGTLFVSFASHRSICSTWMVSILGIVRLYSMIEMLEKGNF